MGRAANIDEIAEISLLSDRLSITAFTPKDAVEITAPITPAIIRYLNWDALPSREGFNSVWRDWLEKMRSGKAVVLVIRHRQSQELIGMAGLHFISNDSPTAGIWIRDAVQAQGYGSESMRVVTNWAFSELRAGSVFLPVFDNHVAGRRLAERLGGVRADDEDPAVRAPAFSGNMVMYRIPRANGRGSRPAR